jgi:transcriptional regulator GlxA family with amidase domain
MTTIAILTFEQFNEIDSIVALHILNRVKRDGWQARLACPTPQVTSMNGVTVHAQMSLEEARDADAVIVGSGRATRAIIEDAELMARVQLDPSRQLVASQCSGALVLAKRGLLDGVPACTDLSTRPWLVEAGVSVLDQPLVAHGNVATAGGCLASMYLAAWVIARLAGVDEVRAALDYVAPVGEKDAWTARTLAAIEPYI